MTESTTGFSAVHIGKVISKVGGEHLILLIVIPDILIKPFQFISRVQLLASQFQSGTHALHAVCPEVTTSLSTDKLSHCRITLQELCHGQHGMGNPKETQPQLK